MISSLSLVIILTIYHDGLLFLYPLEI